jgi:phage baseplate assembly protein V
MISPFQLSETQRLLAQGTTVGEIVAVNASTAMVKVDDGELTTDWIPWVSPAWGQVKVWSVPSIGTQCVLVVPDQNWEHAVALGGIVRESGGTAQEHYLDFGDGTTLRYNSTSKALTVQNATGTLTIECPNITLQGNVNISGNLVANTVADATGSIASMRSQYNSHTHAGGATATPIMD